MAVAPECKISVLVVDGVLGALHRLGFPFPALASMQEAGVFLTEASWNIRKSTAGLSLTLFWPSNSAKSAVAPPSNSIGKISKSKKRRMRRLKCKGKPGSVNDEVTEVDSEILPPQLTAATEVSQPPSSPPHSESSGKNLAAHKDDDPFDDISVCHECPKSVISESQLSPSVIDPPVFYYETNNTPGVCVERGDGSFSWSPVKISRSAVKVGDVDSSECSDIDIDECLSLSYHPREGVPGFEVETQEDAFWAPIAHRTRKRLKLKSTCRSLSKTS